MKKLPAYVFLITLFFGLSFFAGTVYAAEPQPIPPNGRIDCPAGSEDPNYNSSRPYQASPCGDSPKAVMCGNTLQVIENISGGRAPAGTAEKIIDKQAGDIDYAADLTGPEFPIAGNTEDVVNSQNDMKKGQETLDDAAKVNEYLSWYLNGVTDKAEYGTTDTSQLVDFSGPLKKLLPGAIQDAQRIETIKTIGTQTTEATNHNQIVVCGSHTILNIIGQVEPHPCYSGNGAKATPTIFRLSDWNGDISTIRGAINTVRAGSQIIIGAIQSVINHIPFIGNILNGASNITRGVIGSVPIVGGIVNNVVIPAAQQVAADALSTAWNNRKPPLPWGINPNTGKVFTDIEYQKAYLEWKGKTCSIVPIINRLLCFDNPFVVNTWANLYPYIPLSNTVDKSAKNVITGVGVNGVGGTVVITKDPKYFIKQEPVLYFPHTQETSDLLDLLQKTYAPKEGTTDEIVQKSTEPINNPTEPNLPAYQACLDKGNTASECQGLLAGGKCRIVNLRSNPGDYLFPQVRPSEVRVHVNPYTVHSVPCHDVTNDKTGEEYALCNGAVAIEIRMETKVPYAKEIFSSSTAGADAAFRRIYPKVEEGAPVSCIANIPSVTDVTYIPKDNMQGMKVINPVGVNTTNNAKLYFPYFGSVYDYFLKGIQTALRPKGYGEPSPESGYLCSPAKKVDCVQSVPDSAVDSKYLGGFKANFIQLANTWTDGCNGPENNKATQCYNWVASEAKKAGVNPAFALTIWLNESGASNYCWGGETTQDFGINLPNIYQNIGEQLDAFLNMAKMKLCDGEPGFTEPMQGWLSRFQSSRGVCDPTDTTASAYYDDVKNTTWSWLTNCSKDGKFGITWPTDMSCP